METTNGGKSPQPTDTTNKVLVNVILDRSGSMQPIRDATISGYNEYLNSLRADKNSEYNISLIQFDSEHDGPSLTIKYADKPLGEVADLTPADYEPRGMTPLYDAIGECIRRVETKGRLVITAIITDGMENASHEFTIDNIKALIAEKEKEHWTFVFLGTGIDSYAVSASMGMPAHATSNYAGDPQHVQATYSAFAQSTVSRSAMARHVGLRAASASRMFTNSQRTAMGGARPGTTAGGRPAAPPQFRPPSPTSQAKPLARKRTNWKESRVPQP